MCQNSQSNHMVLGATWAQIPEDSYVFWLIWVQVPYDFVWFRADLGSHPVWMCMVLDTCWLRSHMDSCGLGFVGAQISYEFICLWADMGHSSIWDHMLWTFSSAYWINMGTRRMKRDRGKCVTKQLTWDFSMFLPPLWPSNFEAKFTKEPHRPIKNQPKKKPESWCIFHDLLTQLGSILDLRLLNQVRGQTFENA